MLGTWQIKYTTPGWELSTNLGCQNWFNLIIIIILITLVTKTMSYKQWVKTS